ncbi:hypothetical protein HPB52_021956 [Rhipicephalus sanguineus]|uniref:Uncharacterized protein n=1 Tax=Rhipicephalus sanguineus TaxID=34632 RepID=A0A9D4Q8E5_RHISA|nr:hypothetical protein HPB52_021956 [Rhipicephalus sanguineus]
MAAHLAPISGYLMLTPLQARPRLIFATSHGSCMATRSLRLNGRVVVPMATQADRIVFFVLSIVAKSRSPTFMQRGSRRDFTPAKVRKGGSGHVITAPTNTRHFDTLSPPVA